MFTPNIICDLCRRLALEGYLAVAPELCFRQGDPNDYSDIPNIAQQLRSAKSGRRVLADLDHVASWSGAQRRRSASSSGHRFPAGVDALAGCMPAHNPQLKAAVALVRLNWWVKTR